MPYGITHRCGNSLLLVGMEGMIITARGEEGSKDSKNNSENSMMPQILFIAGIGMIILGVFMMIATSHLNSQNGSFSGGTIILIGPFPIIIGTGPNSFLLVLAAIILSIISLITFIIIRRRGGYRLC